MSRLSSEQLLETLNWRYAVKKFDATKKIPENEWLALEESFRLCPSSYGLQPWKFILVRDPAVRAELRAQSWNQAQVTDSSHFVVLTARDSFGEADIDRFLRKIASVRGVPVETLAGFRKNAIADLVQGTRAKTIHEWAQKQTYIAMGFALHAAAAMQIDACPMEGIKGEEYDRVLGLKDTGYTTINAMAFGYRDHTDRFSTATKVRFDRNEVFEER